ncbi:HDOD domain-containing protein [Dissulfurirhabdus thermomarina]|uniref:HDOD domain-containing protein n=1 Tax=Dissulfurirhabdus thermomarina TaxID=1765737 RepID=A0A6N9TPW9_DISTH|nr:HDOD domain-containing protein [Dissulfurirhabdus thermomarina]NDY41784.1 HDOD domain-containing protein [Dissulfurirhabdus thermomarina]NMX23974.1 HDOD domain-containing protein [Dissulfurirhabdus thermomarina]
MAISIAQRFDDLEELPTIPQILNRVLHEVDSATSTAASLEKVIRDDPMLTAKILRMANSPYYGLAGEVNSIARAVMVLGFEEVRNLVVALALGGAFSGDLGIPGVDAADLWMHSVGTGRAASMLAERVGLDADELFTAGLLHDIGRLLMCMYFKDEMKEIMALQIQRGVSLNQAEAEFGLSHGEVGAYLTTRWGFGDFLSTVVRYHHNPQGAGPHAKAASAVFLADGLCRKVGLGASIGEDPDQKLLVPKALGIGGEDIKKIALRLKSEKAHLLESWGQVIAA